VRPYPSGGRFPTAYDHHNHRCRYCAAAIAETEASAADSPEARAWLSLLRQVLDLDNDAGVGVH
jgi:hypothetical protein